MPGTLALDPPLASFPLALRVLVADDDPASRRFLGDGLRALGAHTQECADGLHALAQAREESFDLLLLDCRMPGAGAHEILSALRADAQARSADCLAVATSAELTAEDRQQLLAAGFGDVLLKPCDLGALRELLALAKASDPHVPLLDDRAALVSSGDAGTVRALRGLLREELAGLYRELDKLAVEPQHLADRLHRLRSSCGFCGAAALSAHVVRLQRQLAATPTARAIPVSRFRQALLATLEALDA